MKQKTIEEKRAAVLAYCERVCPKMYCQHKVVDGVLLTSTKTAYDLQIRRDGGFADHFVFPKNGKVQDEIIFLFYRLLGLETSDAVDELNDMMQRRDAVYKELEGNHAKSLKHACRELDLERARNAALVAALEEIAAEKSALDADDRQISIDTLSLHWSAVHRIASEARTKAEKEECAEIIRQAWDGIPVGFDVTAPDKKPKVRHNDDPQFPRYNPFEGEEE